ncbi:hypothetical protein P280DRAFT_303635 [Massarina eburnea CBS 473.64]|uniref:Uncharacterized protein n=1 Tax=Massarina eburnea CBS 473.64 TaxID=1395130 RepID=A0A6A6S390_9PLEO|nr:hypothetical protein P280DRAFT_303635 [Massarina eburnea CBS 473.64]
MMRCTLCDATALSFNRAHHHQLRIAYVLSVWTFLCIKKVVRGCCKGLVEIYEDTLIDDGSGLKVVEHMFVLFVHRSIPEFLRDQATTRPSIA